MKVSLRREKSENLWLSGADGRAKLRTCPGGNYPGPMPKAFHCACERFNIESAGFRFDA